MRQDGDGNGRDEQSRQQVEGLDLLDAQDAQAGGKDQHAAHQTDLRHQRIGDERSNKARQQVDGTLPAEQDDGRQRNADPEMGFVLRMGYAFIILVIIAATLSLLDRSESVPDGDRTETADRRTKRAARILTLLAAASIAAGAAFGKCWARYHFDAIFMLGTLLGFIALIVWTNAASPTKSRRAYTTDRDTFAFSPGLTVAAWGIVVILTAIYALFW